MTLEQFTQLLQDAYLDEDKNRNYEAILQIYKVHNFNIELALYMCSQTITNFDVGQNLRLVALKQLVNYMTHSKKYIQPPLRLVSHLQNFVRNRCLDIFTEFAILETLKICAQLYYQYYKINDNTPKQEINQQIWNDVISFQIQNLQQKNPQINQYTLVYISERLKTSTSPKIKIDELQILFQKNCLGIQKDKLKDFIVSTLKGSLDLMSNKFDDMDVLDYIKGLILNLILSKNVQMRDIALKVVIHFNKLAFKHIALYVFELSLTTTRFFKSYTQLAISAIQIWIEIGYQMLREMQSNQLQTQQTLVQFFKDKCDVFLKPLLENLLTTDGELKDGELVAEVSRQRSSYHLLTFILDISDETGHQILMNFIGNTINQQDPKYKNAACLALGTLSEKGQKEATKKILFDNVFSFAQLLKDSSLTVTVAALTALSIVSQNYPETLNNNDRSREILQLIISTLSYSVQYVILPLNIIADITHEIETFQESFLFKNRYSVLSSIAKVIIRPDVVASQDLNIVERVFAIMLHIVYSIKDQHILKAYLCQFMIQLNQTFNQQGEFNLQMQSGLSSCINGCLCELKETNLTAQEANEIVQVCCSGKLENKADMFYVYSGISICLGAKFVQYIQICLIQISAALQDTSDCKTFKAALICLTNVARSIMAEFKPYIRVIDYLKDLVLDPEFDKDLKLTTYDTIESIMASTDQACHIYINDIKKMLHVGIAECVQLHNSQDINEMEYAERFKEAMICYYYSFIQTFQNYSCQPYPEIEDTIFPLFRFVRIVCDKKHKNNMPFIQQCVNLIVDIACGYESSQKLKSIIKPFITNEFFLNLIRMISKIQEDDYQDSVNAACEILEKKYNFKLQI